MRFLLIDKITEFQAGERITALKLLTGDEEYLEDHFPNFPVMPGVLMLEAMFQASAMLLRKSGDFTHPIVVLKEARNVKYQDFVKPGQLLTVNASIIKEDAGVTTLKAVGTVDDRPAVNARLLLEPYNLADHFPARAVTDHYTRREYRKLFDRLYQPQENGN